MFWCNGRVRKFPQCFLVTLQLPFIPFLALPLPVLSLLPSTSCFIISFLLAHTKLSSYACLLQCLFLCLCRQLGSVVFNTVNLNSTSNWYNDGYENIELEILSLQQLEKDTIFVATESILFQLHQCNSNVHSICNCPNTAHSLDLGSQCFCYVG